jgi:hypothetical protein
MNSSNWFLEWKSACFGQFLYPSSGVFHCTHSNGICQIGLLTTCEQAVSKPLWHIPLLRIQWKTHYNVQRNCPKDVDFHSKNKFEKLVHLVSFIIRNLTLCKVTWTSNYICYIYFLLYDLENFSNIISINLSFNPSTFFRYLQIHQMLQHQFLFFF